MLLQYVEDLVITDNSKQVCLNNTIETLNHLAEYGYKVSREKAQICKNWVTFLGFLLEPRKRSLLKDRKDLITGLETPTTRRQLRGFLGMARFCRIWIPNFSLIAKPLYETLKGEESSPLDWTPERQIPFQKLKEHLSPAPALGVPNVSKPFHLYVHEKQGFALGMLTQMSGTAQQPVASLSKSLDNTVQGWPSCLRAIAATCELAQKVEKFSLG